MNPLFLAEEFILNNVTNSSYSAANFTASPFDFGILIGALLLLLFIQFVFLAGIYVFISLIYRSLGKKAKLDNPNLAWIPGVGPLIITYQAAKMHWWPFLLAPAILFFMMLSFFAPRIFSPFIAMLYLVSFVIGTIWNWKLMERVGRPGWWAVMLLIPLVGIVFLCIAAWGNPKK